MSREPFSVSWGLVRARFRSRRSERRRAGDRTSARLRVEALEERLTPTALPAGFTEAAVVSGLSRPTAMEFAPDGRLFVLEQGGDVELIRSDGTTWTALHLNVDSSGERGVLGIAFDPGFASNHYVYLYYTNPIAGGAPWAAGVHNQLSRFTVDDTNPQQPAFTAEAPILDWNTLSATNHNGGAIHFGADGMLYADAGDNVQTFTQGGQTYRVSQTLANLLGKQLRIDVAKFNSGVATRDDTTVGHLIPADNPFVGAATGINQLIYVLGLRNPFTFAVQPGTGTIFINDVGENTWEEINRAVAGANFGWSGGNTDGFGQTPPGPGTYHDPILAYNHTGGPAGGGCAIVGGSFYNPATVQFPAGYVGKYFYGDLCGSWIRVFDPANPGSAANPDTSSAFAGSTPSGLRDLKVGPAGDLYYLDSGGEVRKISYVAPQIATQPASQSVTQGQSATFKVVATGPSLAYQWQHLVGATWNNVGTNSATFTISSTTAADAGSYRVVVSNSFGSVTSNTATLTVNGANAATFLKLDTATQGNWKSGYGSDGFDPSQDHSANNPSLPSYATVALAGASDYTWSASTTDVRALQKAATGSTDRLAACWFSRGSFGIDLHLNDGKAHRVALYALDWDRNGRNQSVDVVDDATGAVLDHRSINGFQNGIYLVWNLQGNVTLRLTRLSSTNAVASGLFFGDGPATKGSASFLKLDTTTQGNWKSGYGSDGFDLSQDHSANNPSLPSYATVALAGASDYTWSASTTDVRALQKAATGSTDRLAACWFSQTGFGIDLHLNDGKSHQVALYALDWDRNGRGESVDVVDDATGVVLDHRAISGFQNGVYLVWNLRGNVTLRLTRTASTNAVVSGLFFDPVA